MSIWNVQFEQTALDDKVGKIQTLLEFFLDIKLSLLLYPFFRNPAQAGTCGCVVVLIENWGWEYWKAESSCCLCSFACVLPGSSSFPTTFSLLGNAPKPTYFPLSNNNSVTFLLSYLPSFELLLCTLFSDWCIHWAGESVLCFPKSHVNMQSHRSDLLPVK